MGITRSVYIGVYLEVPFYKSDIKESFYVNASGKRQKSKFNQETGVKHELKTEIKTQKFEPSPYIDDDDNLNEDEFTCGPYFDMSNGATPFILNSSSIYSSHYNDLFNFDFSDVDIPKLLKSFKEDYKDYLDYYRTKYGDFKIKYGVVVTEG